MQRAVSAFGLILLCSACATAGPVQTAAIDPNDATITMQGQISPDGTAIVCRKIKETGTRFPKNVCKSQKVWDAWDAYTATNTRDSMDGIQRNRCGGSPGGC
ncbi:MAG: hypothetical protein R3C08_15735 [Hyphomonas sp.]|nr:hypothetical protein [Hyphomonas sp.]